jgi:hypothetical protein
MNRFVVKVSAACMPSSCWGRYVRVGLLEVDPHAVPECGISMISERARGVVRVVRTWERRHATGRRCAAALAIEEATELADELQRRTAIETIGIGA